MQVPKIEEWRKVRVCFRPNHPVWGFLGPNGHAWENLGPCTDPEKWGRESYHLETSCEIRRIPFDGSWLLVKRLRNGGPRLWSGLLQVGEWRDESCCSLLQHWLPVQWCNPGQEGGESMALYIRSRWGNPWTGHIYKGDMIRDPFLYMHASRSPNLLEKQEPTIPGLFLFDIPKAPPEQEVGLIKGDVLRKAEIWLRDETSWEETL